MSHVLTITRGDDRVLDLTIKESEADNADPQDLTGAILRFTAKRDIHDPDEDAVIRHDNDAIGGLVITNAPGGLAEVTVAAAETEGLPTRTVMLPYDLQLELDGETRTVAEGVLRVRPDVTLA